MSSWTREVALRERFNFGENWASFLRLLTDERIAAAEGSLKEMLGIERLDGKKFIDVGSGSGLFSLAARRLGANVTSFDYDPHSVDCTAELRRRYFPEDNAWTVTAGSVLDRDFLAGLGTYDVVYSWGVLHHTGSMWEALANTTRLVAERGTLAIAIYNDQGPATAAWTRVKRAYVRSPGPLKALIMTASLAALGGGAALRRVTRMLSGAEAQKDTTAARGMNRWHDALDWVGGYPFEVAKPERIFDFCRLQGFAMTRLKTCGGQLGCNEYVFARNS